MHRHSLLVRAEDFSLASRSFLKGVCYRRAAELLIARPCNRLRPWFCWDIELELIVILGRAMSTVERARPDSLKKAALDVCSGSIKAIANLEGADKIKEAIARVRVNLKKQPKPMSALTAMSIIEGYEAVLIDLRNITSQHMLDRCAALMWLSEETSSSSFVDSCISTSDWSPEYLAAAVDQSAMVLGPSFLSGALTDLVAALVVLNDFPLDDASLYPEEPESLLDIDRHKLIQAIAGVNNDLPGVFRGKLAPQ